MVSSHSLRVGPNTLDRISFLSILGRWRNKRKSRCKCPDIRVSVLYRCLYIRVRVWISALCTRIRYKIHLTKRSPCTSGPERPNPAPTKWRFGVRWVPRGPLDRVRHSCGELNPFRRGFRDLGTVRVRISA